MKLSDFKVLTFDCYGTLIDWETGIIQGLQELTSKLAVPKNRDDILQAHGRHESRLQLESPSMVYSQILARVYAHLAEEWSLDAPNDVCNAYGRSIQNWPVFADSPDALVSFMESPPFKD